MKSPFLYLAVSFALGICGAAFAAGREVELPDHAALLVAVGGLFCLAGLFAVRRGGTWIATLFVLAGFSAAGAAAEVLFPFRFGPEHISRIEERRVNLGRELHLEGRVATTPVREPNGMEFDLDVSAVEQDGARRPAEGRLRLWFEAPFGASEASPRALEAGDWVRVRTELRRPRVYQNPGSFDYRGWLESIEDIYWVGAIHGADGVERITARDESRIQRGVLELRRAGLRAIDRMFPPWGGQARNGAVLKAVLFGDRSSLDSETIEQFRKSGLYHLLVVAGLHVGLVALVATLLLRMLPLAETWRSSVVLALIGAYALMVEQRAPTLRATIMIAAYLIGRLLYRERSLLNAVGLAALLLLFVRPAWLYEAGFDLSFAAALLIAGLAVPILEKTTEPYRRGLGHLENGNLDLALAPEVVQLRIDLRRMAAFLSTRFAFFGRHHRLSSTVVSAPLRIAVWAAEGFLFSILLQCGLMLPMVMVFHRVVFAGIGLNALSLPLMALVLAIAIPSVVLVGLIPGLAPIPAAALGIILRALFFLTDLPHLPAWLSYRVPGPPLWVAVGFTACLVLAAGTWPHHARLFKAASASFVVFLILVCWHPFAPDLPSGVMEITALDCGEGDATFLVMPDRTTALINTCGAGEQTRGVYSERPWNAGEDIVSPYLWRRGIKRVDLVALTRAPAEQRASLEGLARNFKIENFWLDTSDRSPQTFELLDDLLRRGARVRGLKGGESLTMGGAAITVLWPPRPCSDVPQPSASAPCGPMVAEVSEMNTSVLLAGNINEKAALALMKSGETFASPILEFPSARSSESFAAEFFGAVSPLVVWTGGGRRRARLPASARSDFPQARFFRTDTDGAIQMTEDGRKITVRLYRSSSTGSPEGAGAGWLVTSTASSVP